MIVAKKWVAAGSTATLLAGGLFLGAPLASAAPGDAACLQASTQFNAALGAAGVDVSFVNQFELATAAVVAAGQNLELATEAALTSQAAIDADVLLVQAETDYNLAFDLVGTEQTEYDAALLAAGGDIADADVVAAQEELTVALAGQATALNNAELAAAAYDAAVTTPDVQAATAALETAALEADALLAQLSGNEALAAELLELFKGFLAACDASAIGVDPVVPVVPVVPAAVTPVGQAPVAPVAGVPAPTGVTAPTGTAAPTGTNKGLNVQTAVVTEDDSAAVALLAALLAVGVAVPVATAARMRRLERVQR
ncbi:hypothetical protein [Arthrobacter sp. B0490]|uniref:hypothetical protein n=1 Tax=Arthrobacter sp. B0490 TaxID=2058891 RepID=UPI000CE52974|nr:hypothetical protein [Arthrobacter sp. B0490]